MGAHHRMNLRQIFGAGLGIRSAPSGNCSKYGGQPLCPMLWTASSNSTACFKAAGIDHRRPSRSPRRCRRRGRKLSSHRASSRRGVVAEGNVGVPLIGAIARHIGHRRRSRPALPGETREERLGLVGIAIDAGEGQLLSGVRVWLRKKRTWKSASARRSSARSASAETSARSMPWTVAPIRGPTGSIWRNL